LGRTGLIPKIDGYDPSDERQKHVILIKSQLTTDRFQWVFEALRVNETLN